MLCFEPFYGVIIGNKKIYYRLSFYSLCRGVPLVTKKRKAQYFPNVYRGYPEITLVVKGGGGVI